MHKRKRYKIVNRSPVNAAADECRSGDNKFCALRPGKNEGTGLQGSIMAEDPLCQPVHYRHRWLAVHVLYGRDRFLINSS